MSDQPPRDDPGTGPGDRTADRSIGDDPVDGRATGDRRNTAIVSGIVAVLGLWIVLSSFVYDVGTSIVWNNVVVGAVVFLVAGYNYYRQTADVPIAVAGAAFVALLGLWLVVSAPVFDMPTDVFWSTLVTGAVIAVLAGYNAYSGREARPIAAETDVGTR